jgi:hypothetical protein
LLPPCVGLPPTVRRGPALCALLFEHSALGRRFLPDALVRLGP